MTGKIVIAPNSILRKKCLVVKRSTPKVERVINEMIAFLNEHSSDDLKPIGLSACQLGYSYRIIAFKDSPQSSDGGKVIVLLNPEFVYGKGQYIVKESCLSLPGNKYLLKRSKIAKIRGTTPDGTSRSFRGRDLLAQVFQHELNHLDGIMLDTISERVK